MNLNFIRLFFLIVSGVVGYYIGSVVFEPVWGIWVGILSGIILILLESQMRYVSVRGLSSMVFGLLLGVFMAKLISDIIALLPLGVFIQSVSRVVFTLIFSYLGAVMAMRGKDEFNIIIPYVRFRRQDVRAEVVLLDSSAIIDGRIADIYKTNFIAGRLVVPRFVLEELQRIADSQDDVKRQRGRRGLDALRMMQNDPKLDVRIHDDDLEGEGVDNKLIKLAKVMDAKICTTDFNLTKIANLQEIEVLNIHELGNAMKAIVITGEELEIRIVKEGKEPDQGVGFLDDGTMVVVPDGKRFIGQKVNVIVSSVLQTQSGKMIFGKTK